MYVLYVCMYVCMSVPQHSGHHSKTAEWSCEPDLPLTNNKKRGSGLLQVVVVVLIVVLGKDLEPTEEYQGDENAYNRALQKLSLQRLLVSED